MAYPTTDDYAALATPWNPIPELAMRNIASLRYKINATRGIKEEEASEIDNIGTIISFQESALREKTKPPNTDGTDTNTVVGHGSQVGATLCHRSMLHANAKTTQQEVYGDNSPGIAEMEDTDIYESIENEGQMDVTKNTDADDDMPHVNAKITQQEVSDDESPGFAEINVMDFYESIENEGQVSATKKHPYIVKFRVNHPQMDVTKNTDADNDMPQCADTRCVAVATCVANSGDHRKIVSHIFGRNKNCTRELPRHLWIFWCRKHYQRFRYRAEKDAENWHMIQLGLVRKQLKIFEDWGKIHSWTITLRLAEQVILAKEEANGTTYTNNVSTCWERFLVPYLGPSKTSAEVREVLAVIEAEFNGTEFRNRDKRLKTFPGVEFLPIMHPPKVVRRPATKNGKIIYNKITLDQPVFNRKTRANLEYFKEKAAKEKAEASNIPKGSRTVSEKDKSSDTLNSPDGTVTVKRETSATDDGINYGATINYGTTTITTPPSSQATKRKPMTPAHKTPRYHQPGAPPTKLRRLIRGYEKHGFSGAEIAMPMEKGGDTGRNHKWREIRCRGEA